MSTPLRPPADYPAHAAAAPPHPQSDEELGALPLDREDTLNDTEVTPRPQKMSLRRCGRAVWGWLYVKVVLPFNQALRDGLSPEKLAQTITFGVILGLFPVLGVTAFLCFVAALRLHLNQPVIQAVNAVLTPLDIALSIPFMRFGESVLHTDPINLSPKELFSLLLSFKLEALSTVAKGLGCAIFGWAVAAVPAGLVIYFASRPILVGVMAKKDARVVDEDEDEEPLLNQVGRGSTGSSGSEAGGSHREASAPESFQPASTPAPSKRLPVVNVNVIPEKVQNKTLLQNPQPPHLLS
ncbi:hypothetical protein BDK51DRAFT_25966 [Blyttiomyces helicus]|uniref:DUF2062 domain-containing protein n=1 Tax=Blyttiomyces helicus TaxID=388810 RepID=A0A4V1IQX7_9FUNG|nr:hypothetical protein BDK51DRAFT_25966 [Blyttiomyces helicus]|eukprot:RKO88097.1 hypothetical protein BDK51DRAFT_25966 [Blyttiomyces helicus]